MAAPEANKDNKQAESECSDPPCQTKMVLHPEVIITCTAPLPPPAPQPVEKPQAIVPATNSEEPEHPFTNAQDTSYMVLQNHNYVGVFKPPVNRKPEPAYCTFPPVYNSKIVMDVYDCAMSTEVTVTQRELLSLSPEVHSQVCEAVSAKRNTANNVVKEIHTLAKDNALPFTLDNIEPAEVPASPPVVMLMQSVQQLAVPPPGALIVPDPYETYLKSLPSGAMPELLIVAKELSALRSIFLLIDNQQHMEGILDPVVNIPIYSPFSPLFRVSITFLLSFRLPLFRLYYLEAMDIFPTFFPKYASYLARGTLGTCSNALGNFLLRQVASKALCSA